MRTLTILTALCLFLAGAADAALVDYTGGSYSWVAYNNMTATLGQAIPPHVTGFTVDNDRPGLEVTSGELLDYATGSGTNVILTVSEVNPPVHYLWVDGTTGHTAHAIFADVLGASYTGNVIVHNLGSTQLLTFSGLDPGKNYTFAGVATAPSQYYGGLSSVELQGADGATNESVLTGDAALGTFPGFGTTPTSTFISYLDDDLALWSGITPGNDGTFSILVTSVQVGWREWAPGFDAIVLAETIPEPATLSMLVLGACLTFFRRKRW